MAKLLSLEGATVTVPSGWTCPSGVFEALSLDISYGENSYSNFSLGYKGTFAVDEFYFYRTAVSNCICIDNGYPPYENFTPTESFTFKVVSGDVTNQSLIQWLVDNNATIEGGIWEEEPTPPTKIKSPVIVIKQKVKQVVIDNANMTIDIYTKEVPAAMATVTITNTTTTGVLAYVMKGIEGGGDRLGYLNANSSITIEVELGSIISVVGDYLTSPSYMAGWQHTSLTGDIVLTDSWWGQGYIINSDGTITGYSYDSD